MLFMDGIIAAVGPGRQSRVKHLPAVERPGLLASFTCGASGFDMPFDPLAPLPMVTADLPGIGGRIKAVPEDFVVEEIPAYEPCGSGAFLYLWIEKRDLGAEYFLRQIAKRLQIPSGEIGSAGLKDRRAITRQMISVPSHVEPKLNELNGDGIQLLRVSLHTNKLKPGHLHGNRFNIFIRDVGSDAERGLPPLLERIRRNGLPNFYGPQRFGRDGETLRLGLAMLRGERAASGKGAIRNPFLRKLALSAAQSSFFNQCLANRMNDGFFRKVLAGDVMAKWPFGGLFVAEDITTEQARFDAREIVTTGPIFGKKTFPAAGEAAAREEAVLADAGITPQTFRSFGKLMMGTRRQNLTYVNDLSANIRSEGVQLTFSLPAGSYATVLLREITRAVAADAEEET